MEKIGKLVEFTLEKKKSIIFSKEKFPKNDKLFLGK
jgi:hypothetical protein